MAAKDDILDAERERFLNLPRLPARLSVDQVGHILGFHLHELCVLMETKNLVPLGDPVENGHKYFSSVTIENLAKDPKWLHKVTKTLSRKWQAKNRKQRQNQLDTRP